MYSFSSRTVYPGKTETVTVRYRPPGHGSSHQATLRITSNQGIDGPEPQFDIPLTGRSETTTVTFSSAVYQAYHGDSFVNVTLTRSPANVAGTVYLDTLNGPGQQNPLMAAALRDTDYTGTNSSSRIITFAPGEAEKIVSFPLLAPASGATENRQFRASFTKNTHAVVIGAISTAYVRILAADETKPTLQLTTPAAGAKFSSTTTTLQVTGKAGDARGIDRVEVRLNAGDPQLAQLGGTNKPTEVPFSLTISPGAGINQIVVTAFDPKGNSTRVSRTFTYERRRQLTLDVRDLNDVYAQTGTLAMTATPAAGAGPLIPVASTGGRSTTVVVGTQVRLVCTPKPVFHFLQWDVRSVVPMSMTNVENVSTFIMPDEDLTMIARTLPSPFAPPYGYGNRVHALLDADETDGPGTEFKACLTGTVTLAGSISGKLAFRGQSLPLAAGLRTHDAALFTIAGKKQDYLPLPGGFRLYLLPSSVPDTPFKAFITTGSAPVIAEARWAACSAVKMVEPALQNSTTRGYYTVSLAPPAPGASVVPAGAGYATINLTNVGVITLTGVLADGTAFTQGGDLLSNNEAIVFTQLPTPGATTKLGLLTGLLKFDAFLESDVTAALAWYRPAALGTKVLPYPAGWPAGVSLAAQGALYSSAQTVQTTLGFNMGGFTQNFLRFTGGGLTAPVEKTSFTITNNTVVKTAPVDSSYTLTLAATTGFFSGTFTPVWPSPSAVKPAFKGVILQKGLKSATGFFLNNAKTPPANGDGGGSVTLSAPPPAAD